MVCIRRTEADKVYMREVASRIAEVMSPDSREQFSEWFEPGGVLRLGTK
jgi:hypothetical protein